MRWCFLKTAYKGNIFKYKREGEKIFLLTLGRSLFEKNKKTKPVMLLKFGDALSDIFDFHLMYTVTPTGILMRQGRQIGAFRHRQRPLKYISCYMTGKSNTLPCDADLMTEISPRRAHGPVFPL